MAKTLNPVDFARGMPAQLLQWAQSVHKQINGSLSMGEPIGKDSTGNYNAFNQGNTSGVLIRIGASGTSGNSYAWTTTGTGISINHGLLKQPIGFHLVNSDKSLNIWQTVTPDVNTITLAPSDATANATVYVF
jgi:hypothetical protein